MKPNSIGFIPGFKSVCSNGVKIGSTTGVVEVGDIVEIIVNWISGSFLIYNDDWCIGNFSAEFFKGD